MRGAPSRSRRGTAASLGPWYCSGMKEAPRQSAIDGDLEGRRAGPLGCADDGLYRYVPVPPVYRDEEGYPIEDGMSQSTNHQVQTAHWRTVLQRHCPNATVASDLTMPYKRGDTTKVLVPDLLVARISYRLWRGLADLRRARRQSQCGQGQSRRGGTRAGALQGRGVRHICSRNGSLGVPGGWSARGVLELGGAVKRSGCG